MKKINIVFALASLLFIKDCYSQYSRKDLLASPELIKKMRNVIELIKNDRVIELSENIVYPLERASPLPSITSKESFILYYPILFDSVYKAKLASLIIDTSNAYHELPGQPPGYDFIPFLNGNLWFYKGKIYTIHYDSQKELELIKMLHDEIYERMHSSVIDWKYNRITCRTDKFLIVIDYIGNDLGYRYMSWGKGKKISDKPDIILYNGKWQNIGNDNGPAFSFKNGDWEYRYEDIRVTCGAEEGGLFLLIYQNGIKKVSYKLEKLETIPFDRY